MNAATDLTKTTAKIVVTEIQHTGSGNRIFRITYRAHLAPVGTDELTVSCEHYAGHRTIKAAATCGYALHKQLPA